VAVHPIEVPKRQTRVRVQWHSGVVSELQIARPSSGEHHKHGPKVVDRIRQLAAAGKHDEEIAQRLNTEDLHTGTGRIWSAVLVRSTRRTHRIERVAADLPRMPPLPHRHPETGRYSVPGAMARFRVVESTVRLWIKRGLVSTTRADFGTHRNVYWLDIDKTTAGRLTKKKRRNKTA
jgi:hypothetical protein